MYLILPKNVQGILPAQGKECSGSNLGDQEQALCLFLHSFRQGILYCCEVKRFKLENKCIRNFNMLKVLCQ